MSTRHGKSRTREYRIWVAIKQRCHNPKADGYGYYGGRGITVCRAWLDSFATFLSDMGPAPSPVHTVERKDNRSGYSPDNCRWATRPEQMRNTRRSRVLTHAGRTMNLEDWAAALGIGSNTLIWRIRQWGESDALSRIGPQPRSAPRRGKTSVTIGRETKTLSEWARAAGVSIQTLKGRLSRWGPEDYRLLTPIKSKEPSRSSNSSS